MVGFALIVIFPTLDSISKPVNPITSAGNKAPTDEVELNPVKPTSILKFIVTDPTVDHAS